MIHSQPSKTNGNHSNRLNIEYDNVESLIASTWSVFGFIGMKYYLQKFNIKYEQFYGRKKKVQLKTIKIRGIILDSRTNGTRLLSLF